LSHRWGYTVAGGVAMALALTYSVLGASMGPQQVGWKDHYFRIHPSARQSAAKAMARRRELMEKAKAEAEERRKLMTIENEYGDLYYYQGIDSSHWKVNDISMDYSDVDCDWAPGWFQKLDSYPATDWSYDPTAPNNVGDLSSADLIGLESVCAGETTPQDPAIPNALPVIPCALICLPWQAGVSSAETQVPSATDPNTGNFLMAGEGSYEEAGPYYGTKAGVDVPAAPLKLAQDGYDMGYLGYGYAAPDPFEAGPICETFVDDCTYSTEETRKFTKGGVEMTYPRHDPIGFGDPRSDEDKEAAPDGVCSKSDSKTQWLDCGIPCPAPYPMTQEVLTETYGIAVIVFMVFCAILGLAALIKVGKKAENYFVAGRSLNLFVVTATLGSQCLDSGTALGSLDLGYLYHYWDGAAIPIGLGLSLFLNAIFFAYPLNQMQLLTLPDLMARKFGPACEMLFSVLSIASFLCLLGGNLVGAGKIVSHLFFNQENEIPGIWIAAGCVWLYTVAGGLFAVAYTDIGQALIGWTGMLVGASYIIAYMPSAPGVGPAYPLGDKAVVDNQMTDPDALDPIPNAIMFNWVTMIVLAFGNLGALDFQARVFASKGPKTAVAGCFLAACIAFLIGSVFCYIPGSVRALYGPSSPHAEFVADSCSRHITVLGCFGPGKINTDPLFNPTCTGDGIEGCDPKIRTGFCNAIPMHTPTCGEWKPDKYAPLKLLTCFDETCHQFTDFLGDSGLPDTFPGYVGNFPMNKIIGGWVLLAIIAASMSTGDGAILAMGTVLGNNILSKFGMTSTPAKLLMVTRASTLFWAVISAGIASGVPGKTGYLLIVAFDIMFAGCVIPMFAAVYFPKTKPIAAFAALCAGSITRVVLEFALTKDSLLLLGGTYAQTFAAGLYEYADFKKFLNWDVVVGAENAIDYGVEAQQEVCPQRDLADWTGVDSLVSPAVCLLTLLLVQFLPIKNPSNWLFTPVPAPESYDKPTETTTA